MLRKSVARWAAAAPPVKKMTGIPGIAVENAWKGKLVKGYTALLAQLEQLPASSLYRQVMTDVHTKWLAVVNSTDDYNVVEKEVGLGPVEMMIMQIERDMAVTEKYIENKWWEAPSPVEISADLEEYSKGIDEKPGGAPGLMGRIYHEMQTSPNTVHPDIRLWRVLKQLYPSIRGSTPAAGAPPVSWSQSRSKQQWQEILSAYYEAKGEEGNERAKELALESQMFQLVDELHAPRNRVWKAGWVREVLLTLTPEQFKKMVATHQYLHSGLQRFPLESVPDNLSETWGDWARSMVS